MGAGGRMHARTHTDARTHGEDCCFRWFSAFGHTSLFCRGCGCRAACMHACVSVCMSACMYACEFIGVYVRMHLCGSCCEGHLLSRSPIGSLGEKNEGACVRACVLSRFLKASRAKPSIPALRGKSKFFSGNRWYHWRRDEDLASSYLSSPRRRLADVTGRCDAEPI